MNCPFCAKEMEFWDGNNERCANWDCWFHKMPRYVTYRNSIGCLVGEKIVLTENIYIVIDHEEDTTTISKLDIVVVSDHVKLSKALRLDLSDIPKVVDKIKTLLIFS